jgi:hypothetical protein
MTVVLPAGGTARGRLTVRGGSSIMGSSNMSGSEPPDITMQSQPGRVLRHARMRRRWSQQRLIRELQRVARERGLTLPNPESLKAMISRWERGHRVPDQYNRRLLCEALGLAVSQLGLPDDPDVPDLPR